MLVPNKHDKLSPGGTRHFPLIIFFLTIKVIYSLKKFYKIQKNMREKSHY